jgi:formylglycine-generating enzyme required for sulfatase activity
MHLVLIPAGEFMMGSPENEEGRYKDEGPVHKVKIPKPFYLGKYEVTQAEWKKLMANEPWAGKDFAKVSPSNAVSYVSCGNCQEFIKKLNEQVGSKALQRLAGGERGDKSPHYESKSALPTEAHWEYACRAGTTTRFSYGDDADYSILGDYAWYDGNAFSKGERYAHAVGQKKPNAWGLYEMHGNVWEWCQDAYKDSYEGAPEDATIAANDAVRVLRGGSWNNNPRYCRSAVRNRTNRTTDWSDGGVRLCVRDF